MSEPFKDGDEGPECFCRQGPTSVKVGEDGEVILWCLFHTYGAGAYWPLPKIKPENWPNLSAAEMNALIASAQTAEASP